MRYNACIYMLSSRKKVLPTCLFYTLKNFNKEKYPIYIYYFDDIYDDSYVNHLKQSLKFDNLNFINVDYRIPPHTKETELFYNRQNNNYAKQYFPKKRMGYIHMLDFCSNPQRLSEINNHEYAIRIDDDSYFKKELPGVDFYLEKMTNENFASGLTWSHVGKNTLDVRENMWNFFKEYALKELSSFKNLRIKRIIENNDEEGFHSLNWSAGHLNFYKLEMFKTSSWKKWIDCINSAGMIYKHRWSDQEVVGMYHYLHSKNGVFDFKLEKNELYHGKLPHLYCVEAPSTKN